MQTKAVVFDFDGTLTIKNDDFWASLYVCLGYSVGENSNYILHYQKFKSGEYNYDQWCKACVNNYIEGGLTKNQIKLLAEKIKLFSDLEEVFEMLINNDVKIFILSGNIKTAIEFALGKNLKYISDICANEFYFDNVENLVDSHSSEFDFEKKADYILKIKSELGLNINEICFVGNGENDVYVHKTGVKTICINPINADEDNKDKWDFAIKKTDKLSDILRYIN